MRFSYWPSPMQPWEQVLESSRHAEATGWEGIWFADHFVPALGADDGPNLECWSVLAALAAAVPRVRLGSMVTGNTYRNPGLLAKIVSTIDQVSGGRVVLGLGAGWHEPEHRAYGFDFGTTKSRLDRLEEAAEIITSLLANDRTDFDGEHYRVQFAPLSPKPVRGELPLLIGGGGEQRTLRIAARWADEWNIWGTPELLAQKGAVLAERCAEIDRDPGEIAHSAQAILFLGEDEAWLAPFRDLDIGQATIVGTPAEVVEVVAAYRDAGVDELIVPDFNLPDPAQRHDTLDLFIEQVAPAFRQ